MYILIRLNSGYEAFNRPRSLKQIYRLGDLGLNDELDSDLESRQTGRFEDFLEQPCINGDWSAASR